MQETYTARGCVPVRGAVVRFLLVALLVSLVWGLSPWPESCQRTAFADDDAGCKVTWHYLVADEADQTTTWASYERVYNVGARPSWTLSASSKKFTVDGADYTFLGWAESDDPDASYKADGVKHPVVSSGETERNYWGRYRVVSPTLDVVFEIDGERYTATGVNKGAFIDAVWAQDPDAFSKGAPSWKDGREPVGDPQYKGEEDHMRFLGWTSVKGSETLYSSALETTGAVFHPVFSKKNACKVTYWKDKETEIVSANIYEGEDPVAALEYAPSEYGKVFNGWADGEGEKVDAIPDAETCDLYPYYSDINVYGDDTIGAEIDASEAYVAADDVRWANEAWATNFKQEQPDSDLQATMLADGYKHVVDYRVELYYVTKRPSDDEGSKPNVEQHYIESGFGTLKAYFVVKGYDGFMVRVYWKRADGSIGAVDKQVNGLVECSFSTLAMNEQGSNVLIAFKGFNEGTGEVSGGVAGSSSSSTPVKKSDSSSTETSKSTKATTKSSKKAAKSSKSATKTSSSAAKTSGKSKATASAAVSAGSAKKSARGASSYSLSNVSGSRSSSSSGKLGAWATGGSAAAPATKGTTADRAVSAGTKTANTTSSAPAANADETTRQAAADMSKGGALANAGQTSPASAPSLEDAQRQFSAWPVALIPIAALLAIALFVVLYRRKHNEAVEAVADAPLTEVEANDLDNANF